MGPLGMLGSNILAANQPSRLPTSTMSILGQGASRAQNQIMAFMGTVVLAALICFMGYPPVIKWANEQLWGVGEWFGRFGTFFHYQSFARGLLNPVDVLYAVSMTALFLLLNNVSVEGRKY